MEFCSVYTAKYKVNKGEKLIGYKDRPVLYIKDSNVSGCCIVMKITTQNHKNHIFLTGWQEEGLAKPSYVETDKIVLIPKEYLKKQIGTLTKEDMKTIGDSIKGLKADGKSFRKDIVSSLECDVSELDDILVEQINFVESVLPPEKVGKAYKVFRIKNGKLYPPMVANLGGKDTPIGVWLEAEEGEFAGLSKTGRPQVKSVSNGTLSYRPGWHLGDVPRAPQFDRTNKETGELEFPKDFVWAECDYAMDIDYQPESDEQGYLRTKVDKDGNVVTYRSDKYQHSLAGLPRLPKDGYYKYRTNPRPDTVPWVITGKMKVNRLLSDEEVNDILKSKGIAPIHRQGGDKTLKELGLQESLNEQDAIEEGTSGISPRQAYQNLKKRREFASKAKELGFDTVVDAQDLTVHHINNLTNDDELKYNSFDNLWFIKSANFRDRETLHKLLHYMERNNISYNELLDRLEDIKIYKFDDTTNTFVSKTLSTFKESLCKDLKESVLPTIPYNITTMSGNPVVESYLTESKEDIQKFVDKFGEDTYNNFIKAKDRLKNKGYSTDILYYVKNTSPEELNKLLVSLYDKEKDQQKARQIQGTDKVIRGNYNYLGEKGGYKVYQPLDVQSSMDLGVNTGWCTTGRYGHYGHPDYTPSLKDAETHWEDYTSRGIKFYYFLDPKTMYGKYALALYPEILSLHKTIGNSYINDVNFEIYNAEDELDYGIVNKLPLDLIKEEIIVDVIKAKDGLYIKDGILLKACSIVSNVIIPNSVTSIGSYAFFNCTGLTSVEIPDSVTNIGYHAFVNCSSLTSIVIPNSITSIGDSAFSGCSSLTSIEIQNSVTSIEDFAFYGCSSLTSIEIPDSVTSIGNRAFQNCSSLTNIEIPNSVTSIGGGAFRNCNSLTSIKIPNSVTSIGYEAFRDCSGLTSIEIPNSVTNIGDYAFYNCGSLKSIEIPNSVTSIREGAFSWCGRLIIIVIPNSVTSIGKGAFYRCDRLTVVTQNQYVINYCRKNELHYSSIRPLLHLEKLDESIDLVEAKEDIQKFTDKFGEETYNNFIKAKDRLKNKGYSTDILYYVKNTSKEDLQKLLVSLYDREQDAQKKRIVQGTDKEIRGKYNYIGEKDGYKVYEPLDVQASMDLGVNTGWCTTGRFGHYGHPEFTPSKREASRHWNDYKDKGIRFFYFLDPVTMYGKYAVALYPRILTVNGNYGKRKLKQTNIEVYNAEDNLDFDVVYDNKLPLNILPERVVVDSAEITTFEIENNTLIKYNGEDTNVVIPDSVTSIGSSAFSGCHSLTSITIPNSVTSIGNYAFYYCSSLTNITIPNSVTSIETKAFSGCTSLTSVVIPNSVISIGDYAFSYCIRLTSIKIPNSVKSIGYGAFHSCRNLVVSTNSRYVHYYCKGSKIPCKYEENEYAKDYCKYDGIKTARLKEGIMTEALNTSYSEDITNIEDFIEDIYDLRKSSIEEDGEYGIGNLVFKELRALGYLDTLKELKNNLKSKELSLEELEKN